MSTFVFANNVNTTLAAGINSTATTITLTSSAHLPTLAAGEIFALTLNDAATQSVFEIVYVTAITGATLTVIRGQENTAAQSWLTGDYAYGSNTAGILESFVQSGSEPGSGFVTLDPPTQQSGSINVGGPINTGSGAAVAAGDGGFGRSASTGAILIGGSSSSATIDYGVTVGGEVTINKGLYVAGAFGSPVVESGAGGGTQAPCPPVYTETGLSSQSTTHIVIGTVSTMTNNPVTINLSGSAIFSSSTSYQVFVNTNSSGTSAGASPSIVSNSVFEILTYNTASGAASGASVVYWMAIGS